MRGNPEECEGKEALERVYPCECGGTSDEKTDMSPYPGLSPRVRGNLKRDFRPRLWVRSISASAGEPSANRIQPLSLPVYPRECGGTSPAGTVGNVIVGLSPRVRGNRGPPAGHRAVAGSVPASAGEPVPPPKPQLMPTVYPRECGGTPGAVPPGEKVRGLSPRVRGNLLMVCLQWRVEGSIPASAGEPFLSFCLSAVAPVYPRECGGTSQAAFDGGRRIGLSPRVRGNHQLQGIRVT